MRGLPNKQTKYLGYFSLGSHNLHTHWCFPVNQATQIAWSNQRLLKGIHHKLWDWSCKFFNRYRINNSEASFNVFYAVYTSTFWRRCSTTLYEMWKIIAAEISKLLRTCPGLILQRAGFAEGENIRPPTICHFPYCEFYPTRMKIFTTRVRSVQTYSY